MSKRARLGDGGFSLVEILIAIAIMGIAMVAVLGALATQMRGADQHRDESDAGAVLASAAEKVQAATYTPCTASTTPLAGYTTAARNATLPSDWVAEGFSPSSAISITAVKYWNGSSFVDACVIDAADTADLLQLQLVSLKVMGPLTVTAETIDVVKQAP